MTLGRYSPTMDLDLFKNKEKFNLVFRKKIDRDPTGSHSPTAGIGGREKRRGRTDGLVLYRRTTTTGPSSASGGTERRQCVRRHSTVATAAEYVAGLLALLPFGPSVLKPNLKISQFKKKRKRFMYPSIERERERNKRKVCFVSEVSTSVSEIFHR